MKPIVDKAEVAIDFPDKFYMGAFGRDAGFDARADEEGLTLKLTRDGDDKRAVEIHLHYYLLADVLSEFAHSLHARGGIDEGHRTPLHAASTALRDALKRPAKATSRRS
jgi:hypothetical protein